MGMTRRQFIGGTSAALAALLSACGAQDSSSTSESTASVADSSSATVATTLTFDSAAWQYDADNDVYYQIGLSYCEKPADESYEKLAILVPGAYFDAVDNGNGTYTCTPSASGTVGSYTAATAPIVMPINTPGYSAQSAMEAYSAQSTYTGAGLVYVHAGCRGRDHGAPAGVTDLKAAVRFLRAFSGQIAGNVERIFTYGHSGGGAQSALMGATGDAPEYEPYLQAIGAVQGVSDAIYGSMDWCPITNLDTADEAYEWMMGCTRSGLSEDQQAISDALAKAYATYVNTAKIPGADGTPLSLEASDAGTYQAGSYYEQVKATIEESLNNFLADTEFPYDASSASSGGGMPGDGGPGGGTPPDRGDGGPSGAAPGAVSSSSSDVTSSEADYAQIDQISRTETTGGISLSGSYETAAAYIEVIRQAVVARAQ